MKRLFHSVFTVMALASLSTSHASPASATQGPHDHGKHRHGGSEGGTEARPAFNAELKATPAQPKAGEPVTLTLTVRDAQGAPVRDLPLVHEKPLHLLVVSRDLAEFAHLHPEPQPDGAYQVRHVFPVGGDYKLYADFAPKGAQQVEQFELTASGPARPAARLVADAPPVKTVGGLRVTMQPDKPLRAGEAAMLRFSVADAATGKPVTNLQPYLGALAHFVILSEDTRDFLHAHPMEEGAHGAHGAHGVHGQASPSAVSAHTTFPRAGLYKAWAQFQRNGQVITVPFVVRVAETSGG
jgi:uncharacterized protein (DUF58 family)